MQQTRHPLLNTSRSSLSSVSSLSSSPSDSGLQWDEEQDGQIAMETTAPSQLEEKVWTAFLKMQQTEQQNGHIAESTDTGSPYQLEKDIVEAFQQDSETFTAACGTIGDIWGRSIGVQASEAERSRSPYALLPLAQECRELQECVATICSIERLLHCAAIQHLLKARGGTSVHDPSRADVELPINSDGSLQPRISAAEELHKAYGQLVPDENDGLTYDMAALNKIDTAIQSVLSSIEVAPRTAQPGHDSCFTLNQSTRNSMALYAESFAKVVPPESFSVDLQAAHNKLRQACQSVQGDPGSPPFLGDLGSKLED